MTKEIMRELARPFPPKYVHDNPSPGGGGFGRGTYVKHHVVNQRLIHVLGQPPSFTVVEIVRGQVDAKPPNERGKTERARKGHPALDNAIVGVIARMQIVSDELNVIVDEAGDCEEPHNWDSDGERLKDAMSDAYKRCAMRLGCGLHLWSGEEYFLFDKLTEESAVPPTAEAGKGGSRMIGLSDSPPPAEPTEPMISPGQVIAVNMRLGKLGVKHEDRHKKVGEYIGHEIASTKDLTLNEATRVINYLSDALVAKQRQEEWEAQGKADKEKQEKEKNG